MVQTRNISERPYIVTESAIKTYLPRVCVCLLTVHVMSSPIPGQAEPSKYIGLVGENTTVGRPSRPPYAGFTEYFPHRNLTQQRNNTLMDVMTPSQLVLVNTTLEDSGGYLWQSQSSGNGGSILLFHIYVFGKSLGIDLRHSQVI